MSSPPAVPISVSWLQYVVAILDGFLEKTGDPKGRPPNERRTLVVVAAVGVAIPLLLGWTASQISAFGQGVDQKYFELVAQIVPVFFLATFARTLLLIRPSLRSEASDALAFERRI